MHPWQVYSLSNLHARNIQFLIHLVSSIQLKPHKKFILLNSSMITLVEGKHPLHFEGKHLSFLHHKIVSVEFLHNLLVREIHPS